jgi:hypothetical protein
VFFVVLVLVTMTVSLPLNGFYDYLLFFHCVRRPNLEQWGMNTEYWMGRATQDITGSDENQEAPIQMLYKSGVAIEEKKLKAGDPEVIKQAEKELARKQ